VPNFSLTLAVERGRPGRKGLLKPHRDQLFDQWRRKLLIDAKRRAPDEVV
jgi:hypothetical protein